MQIGQTAIQAVNKLKPNLENTDKSAIKRSSKLEGPIECSKLDRNASNKAERTDINVSSGMFEKKNELSFEVSRNQHQTATFSKALDLA